MVRLRPLTLLNCAGNPTPTEVLGEARCEGQACCPDR